MVWVGGHDFPTSIIGFLGIMIVNYVILLIQILKKGWNVNLRKSSTVCIIWPIL